MTGEGGVAVDVNALRTRRAAVFAIGVAVLTLAATGMLDRLLLGMFIGIGLALGWINAQLTRVTVNLVADAEKPKKQGLFLSSAVRLIGITAGSLLLAFLARPNGIGIFFGLAVFQVILVLVTVLPEVKELRQQS
ncbi:hypothetical protein OG874_42620 [Nocardia sp. NBC_00565]|uniref:hypothetical protein n=1 Tax=Nocardia sp. NBC_00565 TaxID=2975993 RepID=UPI002E820A44|nr:hypothetical protein [Nocardia sp. NBC_00565]WUC03283.1 hypothetical protein OG874_42620 [Nocardia sp. NBC_00565]